MGIIHGTKVGYGLALAAALVVFGAISAGTAGEMKKKTEKMPAGRVTAMSKHNFSDTVTKVKQAIEGQQMMVVFTADHQAMLEMVGLKTKGMAGIEFFHPRYGKVILENDQAAGVEIPFRLVVMEGDMGTMITYQKPSSILAKYPKLKKLGEELDGVLARIQEAVTK